MLRIDMRIALGVAALLCTAPAVAQVAPVPNVNDCTFIRDPIALRDCINLYEGQRLAPGPRTAVFQQQPVVDKALIAAAGPIPGNVAPTHGRRGKRAMRPVSYTPDSSVRIQQVRQRQ